MDGGKQPELKEFREVIREHWSGKSALFLQRVESGRRNLLTKFFPQGFRALL